MRLFRTKKYSNVYFVKKAFISKKALGAQTPMMHADRRSTEGLRCV